MSSYWSIIVSLLISIMLAALPIVISIVQTSSVEKQKRTLCSLNALPVSRTEYYRLAMYYINNVDPASLNKSYRFPILFFSFVVLFLSAMTFFGIYATSYFSN